MTPKMIQRSTGAALAAALLSLAALPARGQTAQSMPESAPDEVLVLTPFQVDAKNDRGWLATNAISASRTNIEIARLPFNMSVLTSEFLSDLGTTDALEAVTRYTPGVTVGAYNTLVIRGLGNEGVIFKDGLRNSDVRWTPGIERIEILRGPSAVLYGQTGPGGIANYVTKKPLFRNDAFLKATVGDYGFQRGDADFNLAAPGKLRRVVAARVNTGFEKSDGWQDRNARDTESVDAVVRLQPFDGRLVVDVSYSDYTQDMQVATGPQISNKVNGLASGANVSASKAYGGVILPIRPEWNLSGRGSDLYEQIDTTGIDAQLRVTDDLVLRSVWFEQNRDFRISLLLVNQDLAMTPSATDPNVPARSANGRDPLINVSAPVLVQSPVQDRNSGYQQSLLWTPTLLGAKHRILAGYDDFDNRREQYAMMRVPNFNGPSFGFTFPFLFYPTTTDLFRDYRSNALPWDDPSVTPQTGKQAIADGRYWMIFQQVALARTKAYYLTDMVTAFDDRLNVLFGVRRSDFENIALDAITLEPRKQPNGKLASEKSHVSPQYGISYRLQPGLNLYGSYSESALAITDANPDGKVFDPKTGKGYEAGLKFAALGGGIQGTLAYFSIDYWGNIIKDPRDTGVSGNTFENYKIQVNGRTTSGAEFEALYQTPGMAWQFFLGATLYSGKKDDPQELADLEAAALKDIPANLRGYVVSRFSKPEWFVKDKYSSYVKYTFQDGPAKGLNLRLGYAYTGRRENVTGISGGTKLYELPGYGLADIGIGYGRRAGRIRWTVDLSVSNVFDEDYINAYTGGGYLYWGAPRDYRLGLSLKY